MELVTELAIILIAAGVFTVISKALKQPLILGYIVAGFLVGPHIGLFPQFSEASVKDWSEIGIIFLLFSLGLEFSLKKLIKVGSSALITAASQCTGMFFVGIITGSIMGWSTMESIFLGGMLSMSSTTVILKTYTDLGLKNKPYASLVFGSLVFEDLIAVLLMVLLSTLAVSNSVEGGQLALALGKLAFFIVLWFVVGIYLIPTILRKTKRYLSDEILLIVSIGMCFGMVVFANKVGFSSALGAFVMGSIFAETIEGEHIARLTTSIKDLFGAIFFVSIGMMVDPVVIAEHWPAILALTLVAMIGILIFSSAGVLMSGKGLNTAVHAGFSLAQLGEFAFIIAGVGCSLGVLRDFIYPVIISVSVITTFTTPYMIKAGDPVYAWLHTHLPQKVLNVIDQPESDNHNKSKAEKNEWALLLKSYFTRIGLYSVIIIALETILGSLLPKIMMRIAPDMGATLSGVICLVLTLAILSPFLYGLAVTNGSISKPAGKLYKASAANRWTIIAMMYLRVMIAVVFVVVLVTSYFKLAWWALLLVVIVVFAAFTLAKFNLRKFTVFESRFIANLNAKEEYEKKQAPVATAFHEQMADYDVCLEHVTVSPDFKYAGLTLREMPFRHKSGVNVVKILRGSRGIEIPSGDERIFPGDTLLVVGTNEQVASFMSIMDEYTVPPDEDGQKDPFRLELIDIKADSVLAGQSLRESAMKSSGCMVVSVCHDGVITTNPSPEYVFCVGDSLWLAGSQSAIEWYKS